MSQPPEFAADSDRLPAWRKSAGSAWVSSGVAASRTSSAWATGTTPAPRSPRCATWTNHWRAGAPRSGGAARVYTSLDALLEDPEIDAVEILTPHHLHESQARAALEAGKHVSLQKPPTRDLAEFDRLAETAHRSGRTFRVFENFMYYPPHQKALELVEQGAVGVPLSIRIKTAAGRFDEGWEVRPETQAWRTDPETCGGGPTTFDHGYHCFHMGQLFIPARVERVHAFVHWTKLAENTFYDGPALISWQYQGDPPRYGSWEVIASVAMRVRSDYYVSDDRMEIHGSEGILWVNRCTGQLLG